MDSSRKYISYNSLLIIDPNAYKSMIMIIFLWSILIPVLIISEIPALLAWSNLSPIFGILFAFATGVVVIKIIKYFIYKCIDPKENSFSLLFKSIPIAVLLSITYSAIPIFFFIGGVKSISSDTIKSIDYSIFALSTFLIMLIAGINIAAIISAVLSTSILRTLNKGFVN